MFVRGTNMEQKTHKKPNLETLGVGSLRPRSLLPSNALRNGGPLLASDLGRGCRAEK